MHCFAQKINIENANHSHKEACRILKRDEFIPDILAVRINGVIHEI